jgi:signal transduction histidine kinase
MTTESKATEEASLMAAYREHSARQLSKSVSIANIIALVGMPSGIMLDYFLYPGQLLQFVAIRFGVDFALLIINGLLFLKRANPSLWYAKTMGLISALIINSSFCLMIYITEGAKSPYFAGLILVSMLWSTLLPWTVVQTLLMFVGSIAIYVIACVANSAAHGAPIALIGFNISFLAITCIVGSGTTFFQSRARLEEFRLRHKLDVQNQELQDLDRLKTQFFSNVSHELRTPLTLILGPVETILSRSDKLDSKVHEGLLLVHRNTLRLLKLINDLLDLTRLDQNTDILRKSKMSVGVFVRGVVESVRHLGLTKKLKIRVEDGDPAVTVVADPARVEKVLINLLTNAIKYTPPGGAITVRWAGDATDVRIEVQDTGVGIPEADLPKIFDRFHQVRGNAANLIQGVGIGLALARELVERHGGKLEVESELEKGATFRIRLPVGADADAEQTAPESPADAEVEEPFEKAFRSADRTWRSAGDESALPTMGHGERTVLVADDESDMRRYVVSLLAEEYRVVQTQHGSNVAELVAEHQPDLVLLDWMMPGKDGLSVCRELRANPACKDLKIVLLTARIDEQSKIDALKSGADDFLTKPFSSIEVKTRVANLIRAGQLQKDLRGRNEELAGTITKLQRTESMLIQSEKMNAIGSLSAGLLHEINNPLNYTLTAISFAGQFKDTLGDDMKEILADIEEGMIRIRNVVTDLKNFAYPEKPGAETEFTLMEVLKSARKIVAGEIERVEVDVDLPEDIVVRGQKTQLMHVFINLLNNAGLALRDGPVHGAPRITIRGSVVEEMATVEVADNGPGVPPEIMGRVFEPFFTTRDVGAGMGMGLSICHTIMESHQGSIRVGNRAEGGAIFTITLPIAQEVQKSC